MVDNECIVDKLVSEASKKDKHKRCIHNKRLSRCRLCPNGGKDLKPRKIKNCIHNDLITKCSICRGQRLCIHNKRKSRCTICDGSEICIHNKRKSRCSICDGSEICIHNKFKQGCRLCGGSTICIHNKDKHYCKECEGSGLCEHNRNKYTCKKCLGNSICEHNKVRTFCFLCGGGAMCIHGKKKYICVDCKGSQICKHNKDKRYCKDCDGRGLCKNEWCSTTKRHNGYCARCCLFQFPDMKLSKNYKTKERTTVSKIEEYFPNLIWVKDKTIEGGCSMRRPDLLVDMGSHIIIIEIDENKHNTESYSCENKRICQIWNDVGERNIIFIRFNPDSYTNSEGVKIKSCFKENRKIGALTLNPQEEQQWKERIDKLLETIEYWTNNVPDKLIDIVFLFYDEIIEENDEEKE